MQRILYRPICHVTILHSIRSIEISLLPILRNSSYYLRNYMR